jgi:hypothetical protein
VAAAGHRRQYQLDLLGLAEDDGLYIREEAPGDLGGLADNVLPLDVRSLGVYGSTIVGTCV